MHVLKTMVVEKAKGVLAEFKKFALKGNMIDMAVGIIIGGAFATVVKSLVDDVFMPIIAWLLKAPDFSNVFVVLRNPTDLVFTSVAAAREGWATVLAIGQFLNACIAFFIVAFALFILIKAINKLKIKEEKKEKAKWPTEIELLSDIRDILKNSTEK